ncbi:hypothetical protein ACFQZ4_49425 [Catellatospora coxensis]
MRPDGVRVAASPPGRAGIGEECVVDDVVAVPLSGGGMILIEGADQAAPEAR